MSKDVFIKMREEEYEEIPNEIKERFFNSKNITKEVNDWNENMQDPIYAQCYKAIKEEKKRLSEREFQLREQRRNNLKQK